MNRKSIIGALVALLLLTGIIGANLVMAQGHKAVTGTSVRSEEATTSDADNLECPDQGLPACQGQMHDEKSEGPENESDDAEEADDKADGPENEANEGNNNR
ncbi:MAG: hypothetical protein QOG54_2895 [Actinomycetota bacterium]|jgi:hypothetical protein|nr:hypothetical protein [Actinomycetota bacterium]